jgi:putative tricarboxylic transport membrane protein
LKKRDQWTSIFWGGAGLYIAYEGYRLRLGTLGSPGCGFFIFLSGIVLAGLSLLLFLETLLRPKIERPGLWEGATWTKGAKMMAALVIYVLVLKGLGFIPSTFLLLLFLFKGLEPQKWRVALILAAATTATCYFLFGIFLELQFPPGLLQSFLG